VWQLNDDIGCLYGRDSKDARFEAKLVSRLPSDQRYDAVRSGLHLDLGRDSILDDSGDYALESVARRFADHCGGLRPWLLSHVSGKRCSINLSLAARGAGSLDVAGVDQAPDRVGADTQELGCLAYPQRIAHL